LQNPFIQNVFCDETVARLKYCERGETFIPLSAHMAKALLILWADLSGYWWFSV
jgi:hypothetical protein